MHLQHELREEVVRQPGLLQRARGGRVQRRQRRGRRRAISGSCGGCNGRHSVGSCAREPAGLFGTCRRLLERRSGPLGRRESADGVRILAPRHVDDAEVVERRGAVADARERAARRVEISRGRRRRARGCCARLRAPGSSVNARLAGAPRPCRARGRESSRSRDCSARRRPAGRAAARARTRVAPARAARAPGVSCRACCAPPRTSGA